MILHRDGSGRRMGAEPRPASVPELARVLRNTRTARGLDLHEASRQTGIPLEQLQDLESGTVDRLPDRVAVLQALSRYATFLDLPAEQCVMTLVEHWPAGSPGTGPVVVVHQGHAQGSAPLSAQASGPSAPPTVLNNISGPDSRMLLTNGPPTSIGPPVLSGRHNTTEQVPTVMTDTGVTPVVPRRPADGFAMVLVRSLVAVAAILIVIGSAWLVINQVHPQWLADLRLPYTTRGAAANSTAPTQSTTVLQKKKAVSATTVVTHQPVMHLLSADDSQASFSVSAPLFSVRISAVGGDTWVTASGPLSNQPEFQGIVKEGQSQLVSANHQLTVQIGSTAARIAVEVNQRVVGTYVPPGAPFTMTFTTP